MTDFNLPRSLRRHFVNLSSTIQVLIGEIVLAVEGMDAEPNRKAETEYEDASRNKRATEQLAEQLRGFLEHERLDPTDSAIAVAASQGHTTREMSEFFGFKQAFVMRRLCAVMKRVNDKRRSQEREAAAQLQMSMFDGRGQGVHPDVIGLFAEAQRR